ncbi:MAG TPA: peptidoglycan-binding domain-containing protein [Bryobacteraceae bacterium]|jgi:hypothetical protein
MRWLFSLPLLIFGSTLLRAEPADQKPPQTKPAASSTKKSSSGKTPKSARAARSRRTRHAPAPSYQLHPDSSRYSEIQKALADRGYFKGEANGQWNDDSVDALKRFQADQKLDDDGKINSLTLIGLGLGPKHDSSLAPSHAASPPTPASAGSSSAGSSSPSAQEAAPTPSAPPK